MATGEGSGDGLAALLGWGGGEGRLHTIIVSIATAHYRSGSVGLFDRRTESPGEKIYIGEQNASGASGLGGRVVVRPENSQ